MDGSEVIDRLDTFWFFSNIFSPKPQILASVGDVETTQIGLKEPAKSKPIPIPVNQHKQYPQIAESLVHSSSTCGEFAAETLPQLAKTEPIKLPEPSESPQKEERRRKGRKKRSLKGGFDRRRMILGEIDLGEELGVSDNMMGFDVNKVSGSWIVEEKCRPEKFGSQKMPPFKDGMAMKEHLKSWAYAVACTVR